MSRFPYIMEFKPSLYAQVSKKAVSRYQRGKMVPSLYLSLLTCCMLSFPYCHGSKQANRLLELSHSKMHAKPQLPYTGGESFVRIPKNPVPLYEQKGKMEADKIVKLPGQPEVDFNQYAGFVTVDVNHGRTLFYYFVEAAEDPSTKPLVLWLNGGPGCSSLGYGAMEELGPFRVNNDGKTLQRNIYAWNKVANIIFLESPAGVGFSYSNTTSDYTLSGDRRTCEDSYTFLVNWFERFPQYKSHEFFIAGESFAGHYVPDLAISILQHNKKNGTFVNLNGVIIGNAYVDGPINDKTQYDYFWKRDLISDETYNKISLKCNFSGGILSSECLQAQSTVKEEIGSVDLYNIYAPVCRDEYYKAPAAPTPALTFDPCTDNHVETYMNLPEVQQALHVNAVVVPGSWTLCQDLVWNWTEIQRSMLPEIKQIIKEGVRLWLYSGDVDSVVPVTSTQCSLKMIALSTEKPWQPWDTDQQVGGYVVGYKGLTFVTVRGAGHEVPSYQPARALKLISSFLQGKLPE